MTIHLSKVNQFGGGNGGGGGSSSFPIIVTDSGSSLPIDLSGYNEEDTFLNTNDKKIYTAGYFGYELNTNVTNNNITVDFVTGIASGFSSFVSNQYFSIPAKDITKGNSTDFVWGGDKTFEVTFKLDTLSKGALFRIVHVSMNIYATTGVYIKDDGKIYYWMTKVQTGSLLDSIDETLLLDYVLQTDVLYKLVLKKTSNTLNIELFDKNTNTKITGNTISTVDWVAVGAYYPGETGSLTYGVCDWSGSYGTYKYALTTGEIYLLDSTGEFLKQSSDLVWDSGTSLTDKTEYVDKTNGILYLYQDIELIQIPLIDLSNYKLKATTITIDTASITIAEIKANANYVFSNNAITDITLTACETSFEETSIEFTTGSSAPTLTDNSGITWVDGSAPTLNANKSYLIVIFNKLGLVKEY